MTKTQAKELVRYYLAQSENNDDEGCLLGVSLRDYVREESTWLAR